MFFICLVMALAMAGSLHEAARNGDVEALLAALASDPASINDRDRHSRTALHLGAWAGHEQVVKLLCEKNGDVGAAASDDMAAIHFASQKGHIQIVRVLLAAGASVSSRTRKGMTPLHYAVQGSHKDLIKLLVKRGANVSAENKAGKRPLDLAKDQSIIELLETTATEQRSNKRAKEKGGAGGTNEESEKEPCPEALDKIDEKVQAFGQSGTTCEPLKPGRRNKDLWSTEDDRDVEAFSPKQKKSKIALSHLFQDSDGEGEAA